LKNDSIFEPKFQVCTVTKKVIHGTLLVLKVRPGLMNDKLLVKNTRTFIIQNIDTPRGKSTTIMLILECTILGSTHLHELGLHRHQQRLKLWERVLALHRRIDEVIENVVIAPSAHNVERL